MKRVVERREGQCIPQWMCVVQINIPTSEAQ